MPSLTANGLPRQSMLDACKGTLADRLLLLFALISIASGWFVIQAHISAGPAMAEVYYDGTLLAAYPIPAQGKPPIHLHVDGALGGSEIIIDAHGARFASSPCTSQRCVLSGAHIHAGDMVACVPNKILITLRGSHHASRFDAIVE